MTRRRRRGTVFALTAFTLFSFAAATSGSDDVKLHPIRGASKKHHAQFFASSDLGQAAPEGANDAASPQAEPMAVGEGEADGWAWDQQAPAPAPDVEEAVAEAKGAVPEASTLGRGRQTSALDETNPSASAAGGLKEGLRLHLGALREEKDEEEAEEEADEQGRSTAAAADDDGVAAASEQESAAKEEALGEGEGEKKEKHQQRPKEAGLGRGRWVSAFDLPIIHRAGNSVGMWGSAFLEKKLVDQYAGGGAVDELADQYRDRYRDRNGDQAAAALGMNNGDGGAEVRRRGGAGGLPVGMGGYPSAGDPTHPNRVVWQQAALGAAQPQQQPQQQEQQQQQQKQQQTQQQQKDALGVGSRPVFIHIPKTGGTVVELAAARRGVRLGVCAATCPALDNACDAVEASQTYPVQAGYERCSRVHRPPKFSNGVIPNSFCVVRNPFNRLLSEFGFWRLMPGVREPAEDTCEAFESWVDGVASDIIENKMMACHLAEVTSDVDALTAGGCHGMKEENHARETPADAWEDCHTLPQVLYASSCETVLAAERWDEDVKPWMRFVAGVEPEELDENSYSGPKDQVVDSRCWVQMKWSTLRKVHRAYQADFRLFGYATSPYSNLHPRRGYTKDAVRRAQLRAQHTADGGAREVDADGVSRCLKPLKPSVLEALTKHGFLDPSLGDALREAVKAGRV